MENHVKSEHSNNFKRGQKANDRSSRSEIASSSSGNGTRKSSRKPKAAQSQASSNINCFKNFIKQQESMEVVRITPYKEGTEWFRIGQHYFSSCRRREGVYTLACAEKMCLARIIYKPAGKKVPLVFKHAHNHKPMTWIPERNEMYKSLQKELQEDDYTPHKVIYKRVAARFPIGMQHLKLASVLSSMRRWRLLRSPRGEVTDFESYEAELRKHPVYQHRYIGSVSVNGSWAVALGMPGFGACLHACPGVAVDVAEHALPFGAAWLLAVHCADQEHFYTPVVVVLGAAEQVLYEAALTMVWSAADDPAPATVVADYDENLRQALVKVLNKPVSGCLFHYSQGLMKRAANMGLEVYSHSKHWKLVRLYIALALLPAGQIKHAASKMRSLADKADLPFSEEFHEYFVSHWLGIVGATNISVLGQRHRTTNVSQSFYTMRRRILASNNKIWGFTAHICRMLIMFSDRFVKQIQQGTVIRRSALRQVVKFAGLDKARVECRLGKMSIENYVLKAAEQLDPLGVILLADYPAGSDDEGSSGEEPVYEEPQQEEDVDAHDDDFEWPEQEVVEKTEIEEFEVVPNEHSDYEEQEELEYEELEAIEEDADATTDVEVDEDRAVVRYLEMAGSSVQRTSTARSTTKAAATRTPTKKKTPTARTRAAATPKKSKAVKGRASRAKAVSRESSTDASEASRSRSPSPSDTKYNGASCGLCSSARPSEALIPCGHTMCAACRAPRSVGDTCPFCRATVQGFLRFIL